MKETLYKYPVGFSFGWALVVFILCATPGQYIPTFSWMELLSFDKFVHAAMFFILSVFLFTIVIQRAQAPITRWLYVLLAISYGILLEAMQAKFFSNRSYDVLDMAANSFGCLVAVSLYHKLRNWYQT